MAPRPPTGPVAAPAAAPPPRRRGGRTGWTIVVVGLPAALMILPTTLLLAVGLLPTAAALVGDRDPDRHAAIAVGSLNLCGVLPAAIELWRHGHTLARAAALLADPFTWLQMYGAAALGWLIYLVVPPAVSLVLALRAQAEIDRLRAHQNALADEWGDAVGAPDDPAQG